MGSGEMVRCWLDGEEVGLVGEERGVEGFCGAVS